LVRDGNAPYRAAGTLGATERRPQATRERADDPYSPAGLGVSKPASVVLNPANRGSIIVSELDLDPANPVGETMSPADVHHLAHDHAKVPATLGFEPACAPHKRKFNFARDGRSDPPAKPFQVLVCIQHFVCG
jgi:hypothetical protein